MRKYDRDVLLDAIEMAPILLPRIPCPKCGTKCQVHHQYYDYEPDLLWIDCDKCKESFDVSISEEE